MDQPLTFDENEFIPRLEDDLDLGEEVVETGGPPIELAGEDLRRFHHRFRMAFETSVSRMHTIHAEAEWDRKVYRMIERQPAYPGGPDLTSPLAANRADGLIGHIRDAVEQRPLASFSPEGIGRAAEEASQIAPVCEAYFEREINKGGSREVLASETVKEAVAVGTAIVKLSVGEHPQELFVQAGETIRLENFYVDRIAARNLKDVFCAFEFKERFYNLLAQADADLLDAEAVDKVRGHNTSKELIIEEVEEDFSEAVLFDEENAIHTLVEGYMRYTPKGERKARLWQCIWHRGADVILALRENPAKDAYDAPPLRLVRIGKQPGMLLGRGIVRRLASEQKMSDNAIHTHMALNDRAAAPPVLYNKNNPIAKALADGGRHLEPNLWLPNAGPPDRADIVPVIIPNTGLALQDVDVAERFAQQATYTDEALGTTTTTRKTLGQYRSEVSKGTLKLRLDLGDFAYDMADLLKSMWSMVVAYKIIPSGVVQVERLGKLLGASELDGQDLAMDFQKILTPMLMEGEMSVAQGQEAEQIFNDMLTLGKVPSARRADLTVSLTGTTIIADKIGEFDMLIQLTPLIMNLIEGAQQSSFINYHLRSILERAGFKDINKRIPHDPATEPEQPGARQALMAPFNEVAAKSATM